MTEEINATVPSIQADAVLDHPTLADPLAVPVNGISEMSLEELEQELPLVHDGQVPIGDLLQRVMQALYAELSELAETMPNMSDSARKRTLADWVVKTKKQVVKLYAVAKWSRDAETVQKCMNITAFLMNQNVQFENAVTGLTYARETLDAARLRNHDLLTSLDVLTTGSYHGLPTAIKKFLIPSTPLTNAQVLRTLSDIEDVMRHRLRLTEIIPIEMSNYRLVGGRVYFTVKDLFEASLCLRGAEAGDGWFFVNVKFLFTVGGDTTGMQEFPTEPTGTMKRFIVEEADSQLARYLPLSEPEVLIPPMEPPPRPRLPEGTVDAPLVRLFNFLQMMSLAYQLQILWFQAERLRSLGWADYLVVKMNDERKTLTASYWHRRPPPPGRPSAKIPLVGGKLTISITETKAPAQLGPGPRRSPRAQALADLQLKSKLGALRPSDLVEGLKFDVVWEPVPMALGVRVSPEDILLPVAETLQIRAEDLDIESILRTIIEKHAQAIFMAFQFQLRRGSVFARPGVVTYVKNDAQALRVHLCSDEVVFITMDSRTGRLNIRENGELATGGRTPKLQMATRTLNENPAMLLEILSRLRHMTVADLAEQKARYLGLQTYRTRNFLNAEIAKLGPAAQGHVFIQLASFPSHYLVIVVTDNDYQYALITTHLLSDTIYTNMVLEDIAWLDVRRIHGEENIAVRPSSTTQDVGQVKRWQMEGSELMVDDVQQGFITSSPLIHPDLPRRFNLDAQTLRELYSYCCARVAYMNVERQFKLRGIPFTHVNTATNQNPSPELRHIQSSLARSVPALCVQSSDILSGAPAAEAAMQNIRVIPLNWWSSDHRAQVVTCVKLKYVQQPVGKRAGYGGTSIIRPSKRMIYDPTEAVVSFLSENVNTCVDEFLEEWAKVSKMVVIAREVAQMSKRKNWSDVRLISFDLQTVEFAYASDYTVSISCEDQLSHTGGNFDLRFSRWRDPATMEVDLAVNPHIDAEPFLRSILRHGTGRLGSSLQRLVGILRSTLPIVKVLQEVQISPQHSLNYDTVAKAAGWYRLLYGDLRHALDFRIMNDDRVAILDASYSLFSTQDGENERLVQPDEAESFLLKPIPGFRDIVNNVVQDLVLAGKLATNMRTAAIDVGVICHGEAVQLVGWELHRQIESKLVPS